MPAHDIHDLLSHSYMRHYFPGYPYEAIMAAVMEHIRAEPGTPYYEERCRHVEETMARAIQDWRERDQVRECRGY